MAPLEDLKSRIVKAMKNGSEVEKNLLRVVVGDVEMASVRQNKPITDEMTYGVVKKVLASLRETLSLAKEKNVQPPVAIEQEIVLLQELLPQTWSRQQIKDFLVEHFDKIRLAGNAGQAMGVAMKVIKSAKGAVEADDVKAIVEELRTLPTT